MEKLCVPLPVRGREEHAAGYILAARLVPSAGFTAVDPEGLVPRARYTSIDNKFKTLFLFLR